MLIRDEEVRKSYNCGYTRPRIESQNLVICRKNRYQARYNKSTGLDARVTEGHMA
jgi:hypothetical protein